MTDGEPAIAVALEDLVELPTVVRQHGTVARADVTGQMCFAIAVALATYQGS